MTVAEARLADVPDRIDAVATVEPFETVSVKAQAGGQITSVRFREGQTVRAGDPLFVIDPRPYRAALAQAQATLARDQAQATNAAADARRADELFKQGVLSKEQHDQTVTAERLAAALDDVLFDDATRIALDQAMRGYAESWRFADVAEQFVEIVESAIPASSKDFLISQRRTPITNI